MVFRCRRGYSVLFQCFGLYGIPCYRFCQDGHIP